MEYKMIKKPAFTVIGYGSFGSWRDNIYPIPALWEKASKKVKEKGIDQITGLCLPPRSDEYFYSSGFQVESYNSKDVPEGMIAHTFPEWKYAVFLHKGHVKDVMHTYFNIWKTFDEVGLQIEEGMPEIEVSHSKMIGREEEEDYEMEIWIPLKN